MAKGVIETWDKLEDFSRREFTFDGLKRKVFIAGDGLLEGRVLTR